MSEVCPADSELVELIEGNLLAQATAKLDRHLEVCGECRQRLDQLTSPDGSRDSVAVESSAELDELISRLQAIRGGECEAAMDTSVGSTDRPRTADRNQRPLPESFDHYEVLEEIGSGSSGRLFRARDKKLGRIVALKVLQDSLLGDAQALGRLDREAKAAAGISHDHIVTLHEITTPPSGSPYLVLEYVDGESLKERIERDGALSSADAARIVAETASALQAAHENGVVHRDVKSSNILLDVKSGRAKITDFGLARDADSDSQLTIVGSIAGTPAYMSPEQIADPRRVDGRSDVYSLGVVLYECLTGLLPFQGSPRMTLIQAQHVEPTRPSQLNDRIPRELETICLKAVAKEPGLRYATAAQFADDLQRFLDGRPVLARPAGLSQRVAKWTRRNPRVASLWISVIVIACLATLISTAAAVQLAASRSTVQDAERRARESAATASQQRDVALRTLRKLVVDVPKSLEQVPADTSDVEALVSRIAVDGLEKIAASETHGRAGDIHSAMGRLQLGATLWRVGNIEEAETHLQQSLTWLESLTDEDKRSFAWSRVAVQVQWHLAWIDWDLAKEAASQKHLDEAMRLCQQLLKSHTGNPRAQLLKAQTLDYLAENAFDMGRGGQAQANLAEASSLLDSLADLLPDDDDVFLEQDVNRSLAREFKRASRRSRQDELDDIDDIDNEDARTLEAPRGNLAAIQADVDKSLRRADSAARDGDLEQEYWELDAARRGLSQLLKTSESPPRLTETESSTGTSKNAAVAAKHVEDRARRSRQLLSVKLRFADVARSLELFKQARGIYRKVLGELGGPELQTAEQIWQLRAQVGLASITEEQGDSEQARPRLEDLLNRLTARQPRGVEVRMMLVEVKRRLAWSLSWETEFARVQTLASEARDELQRLSADDAIQNRSDWLRWSEDQELDLSSLFEEIEMEKELESEAI